jgi:HlyD family secretion protein
MWTLREGRPVAIDLRTGLSDGSMSEVLSGEVAPGQELLVDVLAKK